MVGTRGHVQQKPEDILLDGGRWVVAGFREEDGVVVDGVVVVSGEPYVRAGVAAEIIGCTTKTVGNICHSGFIGCIRATPNGWPLYPLREITAFRVTFNPVAEGEAPWRIKGPGRITSAEVPGYRQTLEKVSNRRDLVWRHEPELQPH